jgi:hypothetical protein
MHNRTSSESRCIDENFLPPSQPEVGSFQFQPTNEQNGTMERHELTMDS